MRIPCRGRFQVVVLALAAAGCARQRAAGRPVSDVTPLRTLPADSVLILEAGGDPPADTVVRIEPGARRAVVLRYPAPEQAVFAVVEFGDSASTKGPVDLTFHVRPGTFGLDITAGGPIGEGTITFKYARYFVAPKEARERFGSDTRFERRLAVGHLRADGKIDLLPTRRPAADNITAALDGPGSYVVAAPK